MLGPHDNEVQVRRHLQTNKLYTEPLLKQFRDREITLTALQLLEPNDLCKLVNVDVSAARRLIDNAKLVHSDPQELSYPPAQVSPRPSPSNVAALAHTQQAKARGNKPGALPPTAIAANKGLKETKMSTPRRAPSDPQVWRFISDSAKLTGSIHSNRGKRGFADNAAAETTAGIIFATAAANCDRQDLRADGRGVCGPHEVCQSQRYVHGCAAMCTAVIQVTVRWRSVSMARPSSACICIQNTLPTAFRIDSAMPPVGASTATPVSVSCEPRRCRYIASIREEAQRYQSSPLWICTQPVGILHEYSPKRSSYVKDSLAKVGELVAHVAESGGSGGALSRSSLRPRGTRPSPSMRTTRARR